MRRHCRPQSLGAMTERVDATERDRERVVQRLRDRYAMGQLTYADLERRLEKALTAVTVGELRGLIADLQTVSAPATRPIRRPIPHRLLRPLCRIDVADDYVDIEFLGWAWFDLGFRRLRLPLNRITAVDIVRSPGRALSGRPRSGAFTEKIFAGVLRTPRGRVLAAARPMLPALVIDLRSFKYARVVLYAEDMHEVADRIRAWRGL